MISLYNICTVHCLLGWWYVSCNGVEGWAPATFLDKTSGDVEKDEIPCLAGML